MLQERKRPTFNWKAVDNATVAGSLESTDQHKVESTDQPKVEFFPTDQHKAEGTAHADSHGQSAQEQPRHSTAAREGRLTGASASRDRPKGKENADPEFPGSENLVTASGSGSSRAEDVTKGVRRVERRRAAEGRVFEGMRRPRHKRMAAKRASHLVKG